LDSEDTKKKRLSELVALCIRNNKTPQSVSFADFIFRTCSQKYCLEKRVARAYTQNLIDAWRQDKWLSRVQGNQFLTEEEQATWRAQYD